MQVMQFNLVEVQKIHFANGYDKDPKAHGAFNQICNELASSLTHWEGPHWANAYDAPSWDAYADAVCEIDDEPFMEYEAS